jgi:hypothetical protein
VSRDVTLSPRLGASLPLMGRVAQPAIGRMSRVG